MSSLPGAFARDFKCACCSNPWNQPEDANVAICSPCLKDSKGFSGLDPDNFDNTVSPTENFYLWSNGGWKAKNPIPQEYSSWNTFIVLRDLNLDRLQSIVDELGANSDSSANSEDLKKVKDFYCAFMDEDKIEELGVPALQSAFDVVESLTVRNS
jgi:putative endopeptidase